MRIVLTVVSRAVTPLAPERPQAVTPVTVIVPSVPFRSSAVAPAARAQATLLRSTVPSTLPVRLIAVAFVAVSHDIARMSLAMPPVIDRAALPGECVSICRSSTVPPLGSDSVSAPRSLRPTRIGRVPATPRM